MRSSTGSRQQEELYRLQAEFCKAMAHPTRIHILRALEHSEKSVNDIARIVGVTQANASQHLAILRQFGLLWTHRDGSTVFYSVADQRIIEACELVRTCIGDRLKSSQLALSVPA